MKIESQISGKLHRVAEHGMTMSSEKLWIPMLNTLRTLLCAERDEGKSFLYTQKDELHSVQKHCIEDRQASPDLWWNFKRKKDGTNDGKVIRI